MEEDDTNFVRLRGLPWSVTVGDIQDFFSDISNLKAEDVHLLIDGDGRPSGKAVVEFSNQDDAWRAVDKKHHEYLGDRWIEVYACPLEDAKTMISQVRRSANTQGANSGSSGGNNGGSSGANNWDGVKSTANDADESERWGGVVRLRGLPFTSTDESISEFFRGHGLVANEVAIAYYPDGKLTGEAWVRVDEAEPVIRRLNRQHMGRRYIEVFHAFHSEFDMAQEGAVMKTSRRGGDSGRRGNAPDVDADVEFTEEVVCLRLRGLPYEVDETHIMSFFEGFHMRAILPQTLPIKAKPSGEAYVEFSDVSECQKAFKDRHHASMQRRYIELFPCTKTEMEWAADGVPREEIRRRLAIR